MDVGFFDDGQWRTDTFKITFPAEFVGENVVLDIHFCVVSYRFVVVGYCFNGAN